MQPRTHQRREGEQTPVGLDLLDDKTALDTASPLPVELADDLAAAVRRAAAEQRRLLVRDAGQEIAAIIPLADLRLLLQLEEEELDRIDREEAGRALADPDNYPPVPWEQVKREPGLKLVTAALHRPA